MHFKIPRLYDSHTHLLATGEFAAGLRLESLKNSGEVSHLQISSSFFRGEFLIGFGWDDSLWSEKAHKNYLDQAFPNFPVFFSKKDGHSSWLNSAALTYLGINSESGILSETEHLLAWERLPSFTDTQMTELLKKAVGVFNAAGFTHVRDMNGSLEQWQCLTQLQDLSDLTLAIESQFTFYKDSELDQALQDCLTAKKNETTLLRSKGVKFFYDGSLGSQTAYLSKPYGGQENQGQGKPLWDLAMVEEILIRTWEKKLEVSVHVIGDQACHDIVQTARKVSAKGHVGRLNLEHAQVMRPETIQMMKPLHVHCHMQPCHWLSDRTWLQGKLLDLYRYAFPWEALRAAQIPLSFGCDSPIEAPSFLRNYQALQESPKENIKAFKGDIVQAHSHPDASFADSLTVISEGHVTEVIFQGKKII